MPTWKEVYFCFKPLANTFDTIKFELVRTADDRGTARHSTIIYEELSSINNFNLGVSNLKQLGLRASSGFMSCINGEEIHIGQSGIFEIKDIDFNINFFSPIVAASEITSILETTKAELIDADDTELISTSLFNYGKTRTIGEWTLDYLYEVEEEE